MYIRHRICYRVFPSNLLSIKVNSAKFSELPLNRAFLANLVSLGYEAMTPVQEKSLPEVLKQKDVIVQAKTGSGKTAAFGIGLLARLQPNESRIGGLVLCPTRELAEQVTRELRKLARAFPNIRILALCGGTPLAPQAASLERGAHIVVGTPGRIQDHLRKGTLNLAHIESLVLDEADRMLEMGFIEAINEIVSKTPKSRHTLLFSATYPENIQSLGRRFQKSPIEIRIDSESKIENRQQIFYKTPLKQKNRLLVNLLGHYNPGSTLVFCQTKSACKELTEYLQDRGIKVGTIHGDLDQHEREEVLTLFSNRSLSVLVATDVAARGLDIKGLPMVINFDLPRDPEVYIHRIGRTARGGQAGLALSLLTARDHALLASIEAFQKTKIALQDLDSLSPESSPQLLPEMMSLRIFGGRKSKLRPGDILGALTAGGHLKRADIGQISIFDFYSIVAIRRQSFDLSLRVLDSGMIKGRVFKIRPLV